MRQNAADLLPLYVCHRCLNKVLEYSRKGTFGGEVYLMTIMFLDIRGFTTMAEKIGPEQAMKILNDNYNILIDIIFEYSGAVIKFLGDGMMCAFGLPKPLADDATRALECAMKLQKESKTFQTTHQDTDRRVKLGIGINSGEVILGNIGHKKRLDFTIIGDTVNLASRLEDIARSDEILLTRETMNLVDDKKFKVELLETFLPKGKTKVVEAYKLLYP